MRTSGATPMVRLERTALVCAMAVVTSNIWTGGPLLALWIGSRVQGSGPPSMLAVSVVAVALGLISYALSSLLKGLDGAYRRGSGQTKLVRRHVPWLRSMRGERPHLHQHAS